MPKRAQSGATKQENQNAAISVAAYEPQCTRGLIIIKGRAHNKNLPVLSAAWPRSDVGGWVDFGQSQLGVQTPTGRTRRMLCAAASRKHPQSPLLTCVHDMTIKFSSRCNGKIVSSILPPKVDTARHHGHYKPGQPLARVNSENTIVSPPEPAKLLVGKLCVRWATQSQPFT